MTRPALILAALLIAGPAQAREPSMRASCLAPLPIKGATFAGMARLVHDGDTICVGPGPDQRTWTPVRIADFYAPETYEPGGRQATQALRDITAGAWLTCTAHHRNNRRSVARCTIRGRSVGDLMRARGVIEGGRGR